MITVDDANYYSANYHSEKPKCGCTFKAASPTMRQSRLVRRPINFDQASWPLLIVTLGVIALIFSRNV